MIKNWLINLIHKALYLYDKHKVSEKNDDLKIQRRILHDIEDAVNENREYNKMLLEKLETTKKHWICNDCGKTPDKCDCQCECKVCQKNREILKNGMISIQDD